MHWLIVASLLAAGAKEGPVEPSLEEEIAKDLGAPAGAAGSTTPPRAPAAAAGTSGSGPQAPVGGNPLARLLLLPDLSAIGSGALAWNRLDVERLSPRGEPFAPPHRVEPIFQELELGLQAVVDPYARADVFIAFSPEGVELEEAYLTTLSLPLGLQLRGGKLFAPFGRLNQQHPHAFEFVDRPLALARLLGVDALGGPGVAAAWLLPTPWFAELHVTYQALTPAFEESSRNGGVTRLIQYFELGDGTTLGVGASGGLMDEGGGAWRYLAGGDLYLKIRPLRSRAYLALQAEGVVRRLSGLGEAGEEEAEGWVDRNGTEWGGHVQALWRSGPHFAYGARYERAPAAGGGPENRVSALFSWLPSEFQRIRVQLSYDRLPGGVDGLEAVLHYEFAIGAHGAHPF